MTERKPEAMNVLVGMIACGENERPQAIHALEQQTYPNWKLRVFEDLPKKEAHNRLYGLFQAERDHFDLFVKLDADMVLRDENRLACVVEEFARNPQMHHAIFSVHDWMTDRSILGLHVFTRQATWKVHGDALRTDRPPKAPGRRHYFWGEPAPLAVHSPAPDDRQALHFGVHRGLKAVRPSRDLLAIMTSRSQARTLRRVWELFAAGRDRQRGLALLGADHVMRQPLGPETADYSNPAFQRFYEQSREATVDTLYEELAPRWADPQAWRRWQRRLALRYLLWKAMPQK